MHHRATVAMNPLVTALLDFAMRIGKAIARRLARWTVKRVVAWMRKRVIAFKGRAESARIEGDAWRVQWNAGRSVRWTKAADWIEERALKALGEAAKQVCKLSAFRKLPEWASCEKAVAA